MGDIAQRLDAVRVVSRGVAEFHSRPDVMRGIMMSRDAAMRFSIAAASWKWESDFQYDEWIIKRKRIERKFFFDKRVGYRDDDGDVDDGGLFGGIGHYSRSGDEHAEWDGRVFRRSILAKCGLGRF